MNGKVSLSPADLRILDLVCKQGVCSEQEITSRAELHGLIPEIPEVGELDSKDSQIGWILAPES